MLSLLAVSSPVVAAFATGFPASLYVMKKMFDFGKDKFEKYVICENCDSLYQFSECFQNTPFRTIPKTCTHVLFPNHPHASRRKPCGHKLIKEVVIRKSKKYYPLRTYCYLPIVKSMTTILTRENLIDQCEL